jgi:hypothetical protein
VLSGNSSRKLWPKFAGIRFLVLTSLDGKDRGKASEHCIIAPSAGDIGTHGPARQLHAAINPQRMTSTLIATHIHSRDSPPICPRQNAFTGVEGRCVVLGKVARQRNAPIGPK